MSLFTCPKCGAKFDVSSLQPGSTFVCGSCKNVLQVPRRPVAPSGPALGRPPAGRPPVGPPRAGTPGRAAPGRATPGRAAPGRATPGRAASGPAAGPGKDPRRAGAAAPPPPGPPGRAGGPPRRGRAAARAPREKSNLPIILGSAGGLLVIIVVVLIFAFSGDDKQKPAGSGTDVANQGSGNTGGGTGGTTPAAPNKREVLKNRLLSARGENQLKEVYEEAKAAGEGSIALKAAKAALELSPESEWANLAAGNKDLTEIYGKIPQDPTYQHLTTDEWEDLLFESDAEEKWGTSEQYAELQKKLDKVLKHYNKLKNDRSYKDLFIIKKIVEKHAAYGEFDNVSYMKPGNPYIVFSEYDAEKGPAVAKRAKEIVERDADLLKTLYKNFHIVFGEKFDLPEVSELERDDMRTLKVFTFFNRESFDKYQKLIGQRLPPGAAAYYMPRDQWVTLYEAPGAETFKDGQANFNLNKVLHEGAHQLVHLYKKVLMERETGEEVIWESSKTRSKCHWFQEGLAEFFAPAQKKADGSWECLIKYRYRLDELRMTRTRKLSEWSFDELRRITSGGDLQRSAARKGLGQQVRLASLFYAQSWTFVHFLYFFENGKYRDKFLEYAKMEFTGRSGPDLFEKLWFGDSKVDWSTVEKEWQGYVKELMK